MNTQNDGEEILFIGLANVKPGKNFDEKLLGSKTAAYVIVLTKAKNRADLRRQLSMKLNEKFKLKLIRLEEVDRFEDRSKKGAVSKELIEASENISRGLLDLFLGTLHTYPDAEGL
jgi:hypothetical protein